MFLKASLAHIRWYYLLFFSRYRWPCYCCQCKHGVAHTKWHCKSTTFEISNGDITNDEIPTFIHFGPHTMTVPTPMNSRKLKVNSWNQSRPWPDSKATISSVPCHDIARILLKMRRKTILTPVNHCNETTISDLCLENEQTQCLTSTTTCSQIRH